MVLLRRTNKHNLKVHMGKALSYRYLLPRYLGRYSSVQVAEHPEFGLARLVRYLEQARGRAKQGFG